MDKMNASRMRIAIISDIHANPKALEDVLADARSQGCERIICLGDIVGYGYDPVSCIDLCRKNDVKCLLGNHDAGLVGKLGLSWFSDTACNGILRHRPLVDEERKNWLRSLPYLHKESFGAFRVCFSHGTMEFPEEFNYIQDLVDASVEMSLMSSASVDLLFVGHTHYAEAYGKDFDDTLYMMDSVNAPDLTINPNHYKQLVVNVGSVGYPRCQDGSFYVVFDTEEQRIHYRCLPFDFNGYIKELGKVKIDLPSWLESKLKGET